MTGGFGGKGARALKIAAGSGLGQLVGALLAAFFLRLVTGPGPELLASPGEDETEDSDSHKGGVAKSDVAPVTIRWSNISCTLSDKRGKLVSERFLLSFIFILLIYSCLVSR